MMFCPKCGARYDENMQQCEKCGSLLLEDFMSKAKRRREKNLKRDKNNGSSGKLCPKCGVECNENREQCEICGSSLLEDSMSKAERRKERNLKIGKGKGSLEKIKSMLRRSKRETDEKTIDSLKDLRSMLKRPKRKIGKYKSSGSLGNIRSKLKRPKREIKEENIEDLSSMLVGNGRRIEDENIEDLSSMLVGNGRRIGEDEEDIEDLKSIIKELENEIKEDREAVDSLKGMFIEPKIETTENKSNYLGDLKSILRQSGMGATENKSMDNLMKSINRLRQLKEKDKSKGNLIKRISSKFKRPRTGKKENKGSDDDLKGLNGNIRSRKWEKEDKGNTNSIKRFNGFKLPELNVSESMNNATKTMILICIFLMAGLGVTTGILLQNPAINTQYSTNTSATTVPQNLATQSDPLKWHEVLSYTGTDDYNNDFTIQGSRFKVLISATPKITYSANILNANVYDGNSVVGSGSLSWGNTESPDKKEYKIPISQGKGTYKIVIHSADLNSYTVTVWDYY